MTDDDVCEICSRIMCGSGLASSFKKIFADKMCCVVIEQLVRSVQRLTAKQSWPEIFLKQYPHVTICFAFCLKQLDLKGRLGNAFYEFQTARYIGMIALCSRLTNFTGCLLILMLNTRISVTKSCTAALLQKPSEWFHKSYKFNHTTVLPDTMLIPGVA